MPRKRTIPDTAVLDAALALAEGAGPGALTFASLSAESGLAPATLVQRFGTKAGLLQAALLRAWDLLDEATAAADEAAGDGPEGVVDLVVRLGGQYDPAEDADQILLLREDLRDPVLRARGQAWIAALAAAVERRLEGAEPGVGRLVVAQWQGSLTVWQFHREGDLDVALGTAVASLLTALGFPVSPPRRRRRRRGTPPPR
jgi:AcrR family transcriptional regulator